MIDVSATSRPAKLAGLIAVRVLLHDSRPARWTEHAGFNSVTETKYCLYAGFGET